MQILYPPRPKSKIPPTSLAGYDNGEWLAQRKFNGTRLVIHIPVDRSGIYALTRHGTLPKQWKLTKPVADQFASLNLNSGDAYWLDGELLNNKTTDERYKDRIVLFDVLQAGEYLYLDPEQHERIDMLRDICGDPREHEPGGIALQARPNVWMAETFDTDFKKRFLDYIDRDEIEGLVLRQKESVLDNFGQKEYDVDWLLRVRKPHKNYNF